MDRISVRRNVRVDVDRALNTFWSEDGISQFWESIEHTEVTVDDGLMQELSMAVERDGQIERIRIVRFREQDEIVFFNPVPPPSMRVHRGAWRFKPGDNGECEVEAEREYRLIRRQDESDHDHRVRRVTFARSLRERLGRLLDAFADYSLSQEAAR